MTNQGDAGGSSGAESRLGMAIEEVLVGAPHEGDAGEGLVIRTNRGDIRAILHAAPDTKRAVIWVCGARGGFGGPASGMYADLSEEFIGNGITSLRMDYRQPNEIQECALDLLAGVNFLRAMEYGPVVVVGHSFGGAVVIAAGAFSDHVAGVVSLSPQTYGAQGAGMLSPTPLLVVHGKADTRLPFSCAVAIHDWAKDPRELVLYEGAEHRLDECRIELMDLLRDWIPDKLTAGAEV
ncbi:MAG: dienelactone hydrolase family protein [Chloroflexi bacterium]|nr:dienelactone hydrolase family protein [Chloroflexota bacterium]